MRGIKDIFPIKIFNDGYEKSFFDTTSFNEVVAIVGNSTWEVLQAKKVLQVTWQESKAYSQPRNMLGRKMVEIYLLALKAHRSTWPAWPLKKTKQQRLGEKTAM